MNKSQFIEIKSMLLAGCEELCNRALSFDESSRQAFAKLVGKNLSVNTYIDLPFGRSELNFLLMFCEKGLIFSVLNENDFIDNSYDADATIRTSSFQLLSRLFSEKGLLERDGVVDVQGDRALVSQVQAILFNLDLDWEEPLSRVTGDIVAHELSRFAHDAKNVLKNSGAFFSTLFDKGVQKTVTQYAAKSEILEKNDFDQFKRDVNELSLFQEKLLSRANKLLANSKNGGLAGKDLGR